MKDDIIYFDHASTSPLSLEVLKIINSSNLNYWGNVSATYKYGIKCSTELESVRNNIALILKPLMRKDMQLVWVTLISFSL